MADAITLSAAMRSNLLSLQNTAALMATTQERLATGKKVNSALDNPTSYFAAQSLTNRANDLSNLLDGMGQGIQVITAATQGITAVESLITQMQAVANTALQNTTAATSATQSTTATGPVDAVGQVATNGTQSGTGAITVDGASTADSVHLLTNLTNYSTSASLGISSSANGATASKLTIADGAGTTLTYTVSATSTLKDLQTFLSSSKLSSGSGAAAITFTTAVNASGQLAVSVASGGSTGDTITVGGTLATDLGVNSSSLLGGGTGGVSVGGTVVSATDLGTGPTALANNDSTTGLFALTNSAGSSLGVKFGDTLTYQLGSGAVVTFTVGASNLNATAGENGGGSTVKDLETWFNAQNPGTFGTSGVQIKVNATGKLYVANANTSLALSLGGSLSTELGVSGSTGSSSSTVASLAAYVAPQSVVPQASSSTLLQSLTTANGELVTDGATGGTGVGDTLVIGTSTGSTTLSISSGETVGDLLTQINSVNSNLSVSLGTNGKLVVNNLTSGTVTFGGTADGLFGGTSGASATVATNSAGNPTTIDTTLYNGFTINAATTGSSAPSATYTAQFDTLRTQLDQLVDDSSYQGTNLISGTTNSPLTVVFNDAAQNPNQLVINAVDLTSTGLGIQAAGGTAAGAWTSSAAVTSALSALTSANSTLRNSASTLGQNLTTVQTRQSFTTNLINTLQDGAGDLTDADMNEESANMLALQTQQQLGTSSLSLASQAAQAVLKLFP